MKYAWYIGLFLAVVPVQTTVLGAVEVGGIRPDLCLITAVLVGLTVGPFEGLLMGLGLGFVQDLFSAGPVGLNLVTKGVFGCLAGLASRYVASITTTTALLVVLGLSALSGIAFLLSGRAGEGPSDVLYGLGFVLLPQAVYDAAVAVGVYSLIVWRTKPVDNSNRLTSLLS